MENVAQSAQTTAVAKKNSVATVIAASMVGTTIEYFDFYAYGTAAAIYFPKLFFPNLTPLWQRF